MRVRSMVKPDRLTPYEHETTDALIAEARQIAGQPYVTINGIDVPINTDSAFFDRSRRLLVELTDVLEAAQAQVARNIDLLSQVARLRAHMRCIAQACQEHGEATAVAQQALQDGQYPADLLEAVRLLASVTIHVGGCASLTETGVGEYGDSGKPCDCDGSAKARATLVRYGLMPVADG